MSRKNALFYMRRGGFCYLDAFCSCCHLWFTIPNNAFEGIQDLQADFFYLKRVAAYFRCRTHPLPRLINEYHFASTSTRESVIHIVVRTATLPHSLSRPFFPSPPICGMTFGFVEMAKIEDRIIGLSNHFCTCSYQPLEVNREEKPTGMTMPSSKPSNSSPSPTISEKPSSRQN
jgi:hypothetical protein